MFLRSHGLVTGRVLCLLDDGLVENYRYDLLCGVLGCDGWRGVNCPGHFYDPVRRCGFLPFLNAKSLGCWYYGRAVRCFRRGDRVGGFVLLGRCLHLLQDVCVPSHSVLRCHFFGDAFEDAVVGLVSEDLDFVGDVGIDSVSSVGDCFERLSKISCYADKYDVDDQVSLLLNYCVDYCVGLLRLFLKDVGFR